MHEISIYPNPTNGNLTISIGDLNSEMGQLSLLTIAGDVLFSINMTNGQNMDLDISGYPSGLYIMALSTPKGNWYKMIFKQK